MEDVMARITVVWVAAALTLSAACRSTRDSATLARRASTCSGIPFLVRRAADSIPQDRACSYVRGAIAALSSANPAKVVLSPGDTAAIVSATIDAIAEIDSAGGPVASWWLATLQLRGKPYDAEVRFNQASGGRSIRPVHK